MGYRKTTRRLEVSLRDHKVYGQVEAGEDVPVAHARGKTLDEYLVLEGLADAPEDDTRSIIVRQLEEFGNSLVSWNLEEEDGTAIPCTREALFTKVDNDLALALATEWLAVLGGKVSGPLSETSPSGGPSQVASIPTEALSDLPLPTSVPA
ncbi:hypothetical protein [Streptomyces chartreusis]|uniref:hypothetical protein n=1 Tax=Streptomyces chartreusis TaxID=1969 RepID=UPI0035DEE621